MGKNLNRDVSRAARAVAREWPGIIDPEDLEQEIWLTLCGSEGYVRKIKRMGNRLRMAALCRIGHQTASRYRNDYAAFSCQIRYGTEEVRQKLDAGLLKWCLDGVHPDSVTLTEFADMTQALAEVKRSTPQYFDILIKEFVHKSEVPERMKLSRAVKALTNRMNAAHRRAHAAYSDGPGSRKAKLNIQCQVANALNYMGEPREGRS